MPPTPSFWKRIRDLIVLIVLVGIGIQFIRPPLSHPPVTADLKAPQEVREILHRACYDCHSNETKLAWFDEPEPVYWMVVKDVRAARAVLNFSNWDSLSKGQQAGLLFESITQIEQHAMPLSEYTFLHHGGVINADEVAVLKKYALTLAYAAKPDSARKRGAEVQYGLWIDAGGAVPDGSITALSSIKSEYGGFAYADLSDWIDWQPVSTTERYDNGELRVILGNDVAVQAIRQGQTNPFPDGAILAKAGYAQNPDSTGVIGAGVFRRIEFMIRDSKKYASSFGWGWPRWVGGLSMQPYGHDASYVTECMNCHRPIASSGYVFTLPPVDTLELRDPGAAISDSIGNWPMRGKLITSFVNAREGTMSTLYGNAIAAANARSGQTYSSGAVLSLVSWKEREDPHWFGGRIPGELASVELLQFGADDKPEYTCYWGPQLTKKTIDGHAVELRVQYITGKKASVVPTSAIEDRPN